MQPNAEPFKVGDLVVYKDSFVAIGHTNQLYVVITPAGAARPPIPSGYRFRSEAALEERNSSPFVEIATLRDANSHPPHPYTMMKTPDFIPPETVTISESYLRLATDAEIAMFDERAAQEAKSAFVEKIGRLMGAEPFVAKLDGHGRFSQISAVNTHLVSPFPLVRESVLEPIRNLGESEVRIGPDGSFDVTLDGGMAGFGDFAVPGDGVEMTYEQQVDRLRSAFDEVAFRKHCRKLVKRTRKEYRNGTWDGICENIPATIDFPDDQHVWVTFVQLRNAVTGQRQEHVLYDKSWTVVTDRSEWNEAVVINHCIHGEYDVDYYLN